MVSCFILSHHVLSYNICHMSCFIDIIFEYTQIYDHTWDYYHVNQTHLALYRQNNKL